jgi:hypothetical protein
MSTPLKRSSKKPVVALPENRSESQIVADTILSRYNDLAPSLNRIMDAGLGETGRLHAITLFQESLGVTGDPMRNPLNAIEAGRLKDRDSG